jgi:small ligand-binding sensory domain FIST
MARPVEGIRIGAGLSTEDDAGRALEDAASLARAQIDGSAVDLAVVFASPDQLDDVGASLERVTAILEPGCLLGCLAQGVVGVGREIEHGPAATVWAASLPGCEIESFSLEGGSGDFGDALEGLPPALGPEPAVEGVPSPDLVILLGDPFRFPAEAFLDALAHQSPAPPVVGGIASGARSGDDRVLFLGDEPVGAGAVGVALSGVDVLTCVSQGAAPIGPEMVVTAAEENLILELASKPALEKLSEVVSTIDPGERALAATGLLLGIVIDENKPEYERGDFLIRGLLGAERSSGALAIGDRVRVGQTVRFHVRDARSADEDLQETLALGTAALAGRGTAGALLFTCNGRGRQMFSVPDHDALALTASLGPVPVSGFFCAGEIGPVGGRSFLHGFTATLALFAGSA